MRLNEELARGVDYKLPYDVYHARMACSDWFKNEKSAMYRAWYHEKDVSPIVLLKEAQEALKLAKVSPDNHPLGISADHKQVTIRDLETLIWFCEREIMKPKIEKKLREAVEMAKKTGWSHRALSDLMLGATEGYSES